MAERRYLLISSILLIVGEAMLVANGISVYSINAVTYTFSKVWIIGICVMFFSHWKVLAFVLVHVILACVYIRPILGIKMQIGINTPSLLYIVPGHKDAISAVLQVRFWLIVLTLFKLTMILSWIHHECLWLD